MIRKKSLNDISEQRDRCFKANRDNFYNGRRDRFNKIFDAALNARALRGLSRFSKDRDIKK